MKIHRFFCAYFCNCVAICCLTIIFPFAGNFHEYPFELFGRLPTSNRNYRRVDYRRAPSSCAHRVVAPAYHDPFPMA